MRPAEPARFRPALDVPPQVVAAIINSTAGRPAVCEAYVFEHRDTRGEWTLVAGIRLAHGAVAAQVMPDLASNLGQQLPEGPPLRLAALSRRMLATVRPMVPPVWSAGGPDSTCSDRRAVGRAKEIVRPPSGC